MLMTAEDKQCGMADLSTGGSHEVRWEQSERGEARRKRLGTNREKMRKKRSRSTADVIQVPNDSIG